MLSIEKLRKIDPSLNDISEEELLELRQKFYDLGQLIFEDWQYHNFGSKHPAGDLSSRENSDKIKL